MPRVHLVDATYELFRAYFGAPKRSAPDGREVGALRGILGSMLYLLGEEGATHVACASDTVIRSFRNQLFAGYKTEAGVPEDLLAQFLPAEEALRALGLTVWGMVEYEADDALAAGAARYAADPAVEEVRVCTPDKDLAQTVRGTRVVLVDRRQKKVYDEAGVRAKWGVPPASIPDFLALVGDTSDGYPGIPGWGEKSAAAVLAVYGHLEQIPTDLRAWTVKGLRGAEKLAAALAERREEAALYKVLATLRTDVPIAESVADLEWRGARPALREICARNGFTELPERVHRWASG
jgi:5'-3' exonuclease